MDKFLHGNSAAAGMMLTEIGKQARSQDLPFSSLSLTLSLGLPIGRCECGASQLGVWEHQAQYHRIWYSRVGKRREDE